MECNNSCAKNETQKNYATYERRRALLLRFLY